MIPSIRSFSELMAITESRDRQKDQLENNDINYFKKNNSKKQIYSRVIKDYSVKLPDLPKIIRLKWKHNKKYISRLIDDLDYNNQIQSSYELTLLERQNNINQQDVA